QYQYLKKRRIAADGCRRIAVDYDSVHGSTADLICVISYGIKKRVTPAGSCSPTAVQPISKQCETERLILSNSLCNKK
ncbi:MAG: hypothetical protein IKM00_00570, partial [Clostridia bacterium]|nr:hypothetical protein [Clostridia bacterium]